MQDRFYHQRLDLWPTVPIRILPAFLQSFSAPDPETSERDSAILRPALDEL
jgi:hypothetical protein